MKNSKKNFHQGYIRSEIMGFLTSCAQKEILDHKLYNFQFRHRISRAIKRISGYRKMMRRANDRDNDRDSLVSRAGSNN